MRTLLAEVDEQWPDDLRAEVMPPPRAPPGPTSQLKPKRPRLGWATALQRTFGIDVWTCHCGGKRTVRAIVTNRATAEAMLQRMGLAVLSKPVSFFSRSSAFFRRGCTLVSPASEAGPLQIRAAFAHEASSHRPAPRPWAPAQPWASS